MAEKNNIYPIEGVIYAKPVRTVAGKVGTKTEGQTFDFASIILELKRTYKDKTYVELPEFELGKGVNVDDFAIGDNVEITFSLSGKVISPTWHKTTAKALYIKHADISRGITEVGGQTPREEYKSHKPEVFTGAQAEGDNDNNDDLPFILTIPIAIGFLMQFMI